MFRLPVMAVLAMLAVLGTERLDRPLTDEERKRFGAILREHDYPGARLIALRFAYKLTSNRARANDLMARVDLRFVRLGWDPAEVPLVKRLCRLVWSEWTHAIAERKTAKKTEKAVLRTMRAIGDVSEPSVEQRVLDEEERQEAESRTQARIEVLRASFEAAGDEVNLFWLEHAMREGDTDLEKMAQRSGRDVTEFYAAAKRRKRAVLRLLAEERGVTYDERHE